MTQRYTGCVALICALLGNAAFAACDVEGALTQLEADVVGTLDAKQRSDVRRILLALCDDAGSLTESTPAAKTPDAQSAEQNGKGLFGIELRRADEESKGHERLKKRH